MKVLVCVKQVMSDESPVRVDSVATWIRDDTATWVMNEPDAYALEEALRLKDARGAEVTAVSAGPPRVGQLLRECLARGADRAVHVEGALPHADPIAAAHALHAAVAGEHPDLVLTGLQSHDLGSGQVGVVLAERLGIAHTTIAVRLEVAEGTIAVTRELEAGWFQKVHLPLPAVVTVQSGINQLRYATLKGIMAAKKKELRVVPMPALPPSGQRVARVYLPGRKGTTVMLTGAPVEAARELVRRLREDRTIG